MVNYTFNEPNVVFFVYGLNDLIQRPIRMTNTFEEVKMLVVTTPADAYTPYEKLLLPFDTETWILLLVTFLMTFVTILIINKLSIKAQSIVYGQQVETPIWNVVSIFFGVSQTKLPTENFSRYILTLFIVFCLIFRTCWQSKSFEFMTSEPRRAPPRTPQDLIDMNYTLMVYNVPEGTTTASSLTYSLVVAEKEKW
jgi:predicted neutral ceramidase superfamily lipid hydrolase